MRRNLKIAFGIALLVIGLFAGIFGVALVALVGPDGRFELPETDARTRGYALVFDAIYLRGDLPASGSLSTTLSIEARGLADADVFLGVGPSDRVRRYLDETAYDRVVRIDWPGGIGTETVDGAGEPPGPPGDETWWEASDSGPTASIDWVARDGDWSVVLMNADGSRDVDVAGTVGVSLPVLGPVSIGLLVTAAVILALGVWLTVSGARSPKPAMRGAATPATATPAGASPPRPDV